MEIVTIILAPYDSLEQPNLLYTARSLLLPGFDEDPYCKSYLKLLGAFLEMENHAKKLSGTYEKNIIPQIKILKELAIKFHSSTADKESIKTEFKKNYAQLLACCDGQIILLISNLVFLHKRIGKMLLMLLIKKLCA